MSFIYAVCFSNTTLNFSIITFHRSSQPSSGMYPFSISTDEHVPLKFPMIKRPSKIKKKMKF